MEIAGLILAAGQSRRLGQPKQLINYRGNTLLNHTINKGLEAGLKKVWVVLGAYEEHVRKTLPPEVKVLHNPDWEEGMGSSLSMGISVLKDDPLIDGVLVMLSDQPMVSSQHFARLLHTFYESQQMVTSYYLGISGVPALFPKSMFKDLLNIEGDKGARQVIRKYPTINIPCPECEIDIDTPEDLDRMD